MEAPLWPPPHCHHCCGHCHRKCNQPDRTITRPLLPLRQRKEREHMEKQKYQMDLSFLESYDNSTRHYQPFDLLATPRCIPLMVMCSKKPEPAAWSIIGTMYSVHFLHYRDMEDYIIRRGLTRWTEENDRKAGLCLSGISNRFRIY